MQLVSFVFIMLFPRVHRGIFVLQVLVYSSRLSISLFSLHGQKPCGLLMELLFFFFFFRSEKMSFTYKNNTFKISV